MERPGLDLQKQSEKEFYKSVGKKLLSGKEMDDTEKAVVFDIAVKYASNMVDERPEVLRDLPQGNKDIRDHLNVIVLDRVVSLVQRGSSTDAFEKLKDDLSGAFFVKKEKLLNEPLLAFLSTSLDDYFAAPLTYEVEKNIASIVRVVDRIIPARIKINE